MHGPATAGEAAALRDGGVALTERSGGRSLRDTLGDLDHRSRPYDLRTTTKDPIDVVSGEVVLQQVDVRLAGALPLVLERTHISSCPEGRLFGRSWASTLDQRLEVDGSGACFVSADGTIVAYPPVTAPGVEVFPLEGPRWPLTRDEDGVYTIGDRRNGRTLRFVASRGAVLPLAEIADRNGHRIELVYDGDGTLTEVRDSADRRVAVDTDGGRVVGLRLLTAEGDDGAGGRPLMRYGYDDVGRLTEVIDSSGEPLRFDYDAQGRLLRWTDRNGYWYAYEYDESGRAVRGSGSGGFLDARVTYGPGVTTVTDSFGHETVYHLNEHGQVVAEIDPLGGTTRSEWDRQDRLLAHIDPLGRVTRYGYSVEGDLITVTRPDGAQITAEYDSDGLPTKITEADGATWRYTYDARGNAIRMVDPAGAVTTYDYDERGHLASVTDASGTVRVECDRTGLTVAASDATGRTTRYVRDAFGRVVESVDPAGGRTRLEWTPEGRPASRRTPGGQTEYWSYDAEGNLVEHIDALGGTTRYETTYFDRRSAHIGPDGTRYEFSYDTELRLTAVKNPQGLIWRYIYDAAGRLVREVDFNGRELAYAHDPAGQLVERVNGAGQVTTFAYDPLGNVIEERSGDAVVTFAHDPAGRLVHAVNADADLRFQRDALGRVTAEICNGRVLAVEHDPAGRRTARRTPSGAISTWEYDASGRPLALHTGGRTIRYGYDPAGREVQRLLGDGALLAHQWDGENRLTEQAIWALAGPAGDAASPTRTGGPRPLETRAYGYQADGHVNAIADQTFGTRRLELDTSGRVTAVHAHGWTERYAYDASGNLAHMESPAPQAPDHTAGTGPDREYTGTLIRRAGRTRFEHDAQGRVVMRQEQRLSGKPLTWRYTWDAHDRLVGVVTPEGERWAYRYDPLGRRIAKQRYDGDGRTVVEQTDFVWDGFVLAEEIHASRTPGQAGEGPRALVWDYEPGTCRPVAQTQRAPLKSAPQEWIDQRFDAIVTDLVGTPTELVDTSGEIAWRSLTTLWGTRLSASSPADVSCPLRFPGQYHDEETGLSYNVHRYYDPETGRYQSSDPLGLSPQPNPHAYVRNPTALIDPLGLTPYTPVGGEPWDSLRVYRFGNRNDPNELLPNIMKHGTPEARAENARLMGTPGYRARRGEYHARGDTENSPFVSVAADTDAAFNTTDPWLANITRKCPDLAIFDVPMNRLYFPTNELSQRETELLFHGNDLEDFLVKWIPNPYKTM
ncbi:DUF6531 domain-containing protein [Actinoallomurus sp. NBC_01490]|uniref:RHS repeat-associated core domain-containing protein n=1 Tax=Actinoallomurus sp. NBC_01490 TaxID=2903557 RepID=UPI002E30AE31|nr:RHS repeat-associated core domain-containing protein [Actinoallomurus sp. NBC_01490]